MFGHFRALVEGELRTPRLHAQRQPGVYGWGGHPYRITAQSTNAAPSNRQGPQLLLLAVLDKLGYPVYLLFCGGGRCCFLLPQ